MMNCNSVSQNVNFSMKKQLICIMITASVGTCFLVCHMSVAGGSNTEQTCEHFCLLLFFFLPAIADSSEIAKTSLYIGMVEENPEALGREGK